MDNGYARDTELQLKKMENITFCIMLMVRKQVFLPAGKVY